MLDGITDSMGIGLGESRFKGEDSKKAGLQLRRLLQKSQVELGSTQAWVFLVQD